MFYYHERVIRQLTFEAPPYYRFLLHSNKLFLLIKQNKTKNYYVALVRTTINEIILLFF